MFYRNFLQFLIIIIALMALGCPNNPLKKEEPKVVPLREISAQSLNYRFEPDVPPSEEDSKIPVQSQERNEAVQLDFDNNRPLEILDRTITSPNNQRVIAVYRKTEDALSEYRIDIYSTDGKLIKKVTHEEMGVQFPDTIRWSPDSANFAFLVRVRGMTDEKSTNDSSKTPTPTPTPTPEAEVVDSESDSNSNTNSESNTQADSNSNTQTAETNEGIEPQKNVLTFRTDQIYISNSDGGEVMPLTQNEGLIYFYFVWAPDSSALASLATTITEWRIGNARANNAGRAFIPIGRPRLVEKNGRERLLDDYPTYVHPVWSPDSAKIAVAYRMQVRIYDAIGERPTQAAIPLRNDLLLASRAYEEKQKEEGNDILENSNVEGNSNTEPKNNTNANANTNAPQTRTTLPNANTLVTFNPIVNLEWNQESLLYLQTGFVRTFKDPIENTSSYMRWHRLVLSPQAVKAPAPPTQPNQ